jgi:hypothetical protein
MASTDDLPLFLPHCLPHRHQTKGTPDDGTGSLRESGIIHGFETPWIRRKREPYS